MHEFLVAFAYLMMIFTPCAVAHWGEEINAFWFRISARSRRQLAVADPLLVVMRERATAAALEAVAAEAFAVEVWEQARVPAAFRGARARFPRPEAVEAALARRAQRADFDDARARVAARLQQLSAEILGVPAESQLTPVAARSGGFYADVPLSARIAMARQALAAEARLQPETAPGLPRELPPRKPPMTAQTYAPGLLYTPAELEQDEELAA